MTYVDAMQQLVRAIVDATSQSEAVSEALDAFEGLGISVHALTVQLLFGDRDARCLLPAAESDVDFLRKLRIEPDLSPPERMP